MEQLINGKVFEDEAEYEALKKQLMLDLENLPPDDQNPNEVSGMRSNRSGLITPDPGASTDMNETLRRLQETRATNNVFMDQIAARMNTLKKITRDNNFEDVDLEDEDLRKPLKNQLFKPEQIEQIKKTVEAEFMTSSVNLSQSAISKVTLLPRPETSKVDYQAVQAAVAEEDEFEVVDVQKEREQKQMELDRTLANNEYLRMLREDQRSMTIEQTRHRDRFKGRLWNPPDALTTTREQISNLGNPYEIPVSVNEFDHCPGKIQSLNPGAFEEKNKNPFKSFEKKLANVLNFKRIHNISSSKELVLDPVKYEEKILPNIPKTQGKRTIQSPKGQSTISNRLKAAKIAEWFMLALQRFRDDSKFWSNLHEFQKIAIPRKPILLEDSNRATESLFSMSNATEAIDMKLLEEAVADAQPRPDTGAKDSVNQERSIEEFVAFLNPRSTTRIEIKLEKLTRIEAVKKFQSLEILNLSVNNLSQIEAISACSHLEELHLSQNRIRDVSPLGKLGRLRILNLDINMIEDISPDLANCRRLETLNLNNNRLRTTKALKGLSSLRKLNLYRNELQSIEGLEELKLLEDLDIGRNNIKSISNLTGNLALRKIVAYFNLIEEIPVGINNLIFLTELWLNGNQISSIKVLSYLPSLEILSLAGNSIKEAEKGGLVYLPNLKTLQLNGNRIEGFTSIAQLIGSSTKLKRLNFIDNPVIRRIPNNTLFAYLCVLYNAIPGLEDINNQSRAEINELNSLIDVELPIMKLQQIRLQALMSPIEFCSSCFDRMTALLSREGQYLRIKSRPTLNKLIDSRLLPMVENNETIAFKIASASILKDLQTVLPKSTFSFYYQFKMLRQLLTNRLRLAKSFRKITKAVFRWVVKKRKIRRYFLGHLSKIIRIQAVFRGYSVRKKLGGTLKGQAALRYYERKYLKQIIKIQSVFRGYHLRKRFKNLMKNIHYDDDDLDQLGEVDLDFFNKEPDYNAFNINIPEGFDLQAFMQPAAIDPSRMAQAAQILNPAGLPGARSVQRLPQRPPSSTSEINLDDEEQKSGRLAQDGPFQKNNFFNSVTGGPRQMRPPAPKAEKPDMDSIAKEWGFKKPDAIKALELKMEKDRRRKESKKKKQLTADERYQLFLKSTKVPK